MEIDYITPSFPTGRALLNWEGKRAPNAVPVPSLHQNEAFGRVSDIQDGPANRLYHGDNASILAHLLASGHRGRARMIYIDPPFDSNADYTRKIRLRNTSATAIGQQVQYSDTWSGDSYLQFMYERLLLLRELLADDGSIWLHCDYRQVHRLHLLLEEVFGETNYLNTIAWRSQVTRGAKVNAFYFPFSTQYIEVFAKNRGAPTVWHPQKRQLEFTARQAAAQFMKDEGGFFRTSDPGTYSFEKLLELHTQGRLYAPYNGNIVIDEENRRVTTSNGGNIGVKYYLHSTKNGRYTVERGVDNLWDDIPGLGTTPGEDVGYPTQKTESLLRRVISASTNPGDLVLDCFMGSGTTLAVAQKMERRWIGCDDNYGSVQTTRRRLQRIVQENPEQSGFSLWAQHRSKNVTKRSVTSTTTGSYQEIASDPGHSRTDVQIRRLAGEPDTIEVKIDAYATEALSERLRTRCSDSDNDWLAQIDAVEIDPRYDGICYRPTLVDAPQKKREQVRGCYRVPVPDTVNGEEPTNVAVRITDVLGHETVIIDKA